MSKRIPPAVFALRAWTIKKFGDKFYIRPATFGNRERWSKSYTSLQAACMAIARRNAQEWHARNERRKHEQRLSKEAAR